MVNMITYINRIKNKEPRSVDSEPRNKFDGGGLTMDSVRVIGDLKRVKNAWRKYKGIR